MKESHHKVFTISQTTDLFYFFFHYFVECIDIDELLAKARELVRRFREERPKQN